MFRSFIRTISTSASRQKNFPNKFDTKYYESPGKFFPEEPGGHPPRSNWLQYTDPQPIQEHSRDVKLKDGLEPQVEYKPSPPRPDKLYKTIELEVLGYESPTLDSYEWFIVSAATHLGIPIGKRWAPEQADKFRFPLLRSVHVHKKHRVFYEVRTHHRFINLHKLTGSTADTFLEYIERNLPEGLGLKISKFEVMKVPEYIDIQKGENS